MEHLLYYPYSIGTENSNNRDFYESIFFHGNGYMGARGYGCDDTNIRPHQKGIYMAGVFDVYKERITDMVNTPDFLPFRVQFYPDTTDGKNVSSTILTRQLSLLDGVFSSTCRMQAGDKELTITTRRFFSLSDVHIAAIQMEVIANFSGPLFCISGIDDTCCNLPIHDDQTKENKDFKKYTRTTGSNALKDGGCLHLVTSETSIGITQAFSVRYSTGKNVSSHSITNENGIWLQDLICVEAGIPFVAEKVVVVATTREIEREMLHTFVASRLQEVSINCFAELLKANQAAWASRWERSDILIEGDPQAQCAIRYNIYQLIANQSRNDSHASIGARGLTHPRYKGCYFWDTEIFMLPFYTFSDPIAAKNLLLFRYHTLDAAKAYSKSMNTLGARFPWMTSYDGSEQCESWDTGSCEIHITCDIAYAFDYYVSATGDDDFYVNHAAEVFIETARFWASRYSLDAVSGKYQLLFTKGPDEYCGVSHNNTYTIWLSRYNLQLALTVIDRMKQHPDAWLSLSEKLMVSEEETCLWCTILQHSILLYDEKRSLYLQDNTFEHLEPLDATQWKKDATPLYHKICFDRLQRFQVLKQADIILLMTLFPDLFTNAQKQAAWAYYEPKTLHDSTLSFATHALFGAQIDSPMAIKYFQRSLFLDLENIMKNTGSEGLHMAAFGATWQALVFGIAGITCNDDQILINPRLPESWTKLTFCLAYKGKYHRISISGTERSIVSFS